MCAVFCDNDKRTEIDQGRSTMANKNRSPQDARNAKIMALLDACEAPKVIASRFHLSVFAVYKIRARFHMKHVQICPNCFLAKTQQPH